MAGLFGCLVALYHTVVASGRSYLHSGGPVVCSEAVVHIICVMLCCSHMTSLVFERSHLWGMVGTRLGMTGWIMGTREVVASM